MSFGVEDYEERGKLLLEALRRELSVRSPVHYHDLDCVHDEGGTTGKVYIGNLTSAQSSKILQEHKITCVVNCQDSSSENFFEKDPQFRYLRFPVSFWARAKQMNTDEGILTFFSEFFNFIDRKTKEGHNVLIHCLAGAHRAGTAGVAYCMYKKRMKFRQALAHCKGIRPIVDPFGQLEELLGRLEHALGV